MVKLISFDIDGTMEFGDPPGKMTLNMVRRARELGYLVGSCSDRPLSNQRELWKKHNFEVDFIVLKHQLDGVKDKFEAEQYYHIGDTEVDRYYATRAGFIYMTDELALAEPWAQ